MSVPAPGFESFGLPGDSMFLDRIRQARQRSPEQKLVEGFELFDLACEVARAGIRSQAPELDGNGVERELGRRLDIQRRLEERELYRPVSIPGDRGESSP